jgi:hypothetical protein
MVIFCAILSCALPAAASDSPTPTLAPLPAPHIYDIAYAPGWQMVAGPTGAIFPTDTLYRYTPSGYVPTGSPVVSSCEGYWAYFPGPMAVAFPAQLPGVDGPGYHVRCPLQSGWNLIGNPFTWTAAIPAGTTAFYWNGQKYDVVQQLEMGQALWIYSTSLASIILTSV